MSAGTNPSLQGPSERVGDDGKDSQLVRFLALHSLVSYEALCDRARDGMKLAINVLGTLIGFVALVEMTNGLRGAVPGRIIRAPGRGVRAQ